MASDGTPHRVPSSSVWVREPQQERARRTFERVLAAGAELLAEQGYEGFNIGEVCRRAEVSPGALYDRVEGKDALFLAIHEREMNRITAAAQVIFAHSPRWAALPTPELVAATVRALASQFRDDQGLLRAFILRSAVDPRADDLGARSAHRTAEAVVSLLMTRAEDYPHREPLEAVRAAWRLVHDSLAWRTAFGVNFAAIGSVTTETWVEELASVCKTYLLTPPI